MKEKIEEQKQTLEQRRQKLLDEARREAKRIILDAKDESAKVIKELNELKKSVQSENFGKTIEEARSKLRAKESGIDESFSGTIKHKTQQNAPKAVKRGDKVEIVSLGQIGEVIKPQDADGNVSVQAGLLKINVKLSDLRLVTKLPKEAQTKERKRMEQQSSFVGYVSRKAGVKTEVDLRGMTLEEALLDADRFLDDAYMAGLNQVSIIHGKGTGVLRAGISDLLKRHRLVKSYRLGRYGEGETGVTIVELK